MSPASIHTLWTSCGKPSAPVTLWPVPVNPHKAAALQAIQQGEKPSDVAKRHGIARGTMRVWVNRWRKSGALPPLTPAGVTAGVTGRPVTPRVTAKSNVLTLPKKKGTKQQRADAHAERWEKTKANRRARAIPPVDRVTLRRIARQLIRKLDTGLMCARCEPSEAQPLTPGEFLMYTKSYTQHLDALSRSLSVEEQLAEAADADALDYDSPEGLTALGRSLVQLGPRRLCEVLRTDAEALRIVQAALEAATRRTG